MRPTHDLRTHALIGTRATAVVLVAAAACDFLESAISPLATTSTAADLHAIDAHQGRFVVSVLIGLVGTVLLLPGLLGLVAHTVRRAPVASRVAATLVCGGVPAFLAIRMGQAVELQGVRDDLAPSTVASLVDGVTSNPVGAPILVLFLAGTVIGLIAVAVAVWRSGLPRGGAVLIGAFGIIDFGLEGAVPSWVAHLVLLVGIVWIASALVRPAAAVLSEPAASLAAH